MTTRNFTNEEIKKSIKTFLSKFIRKNNLNEDQDLFKTGLLNSMFAMQMVLFVEKEFTLKVENEDLEISNFNTVNALTGFVERKIA